MRRLHRPGACMVAFAAGALVAFCLPTWCLIFALCILVIAAGLCMKK